MKEDFKFDEFKIEDAADANYVIRKFFNNEFKDIKMSQLEQLVLTVYNMGKNDGGSTDSPAEPENTNPFKISDKAKVIEDIEIGHSGEFIKADTIVKVSAVTGDTVTVLYESGEDGEMFEAPVLHDKLEKIT